MDLMGRSVPNFQGKDIITYALNFVLVSSLHLLQDRRYPQLSFLDLRVFLIKISNCSVAREKKDVRKHFDPGSGQETGKTPDTHATDRIIERARSMAPVYKKLC